MKCSPGGNKRELFSFNRCYLLTSKRQVNCSISIMLGIEWNHVLHRPFETTNSPQQKQLNTWCHTYLNISMNYGWHGLPMKVLECVRRLHSNSEAAWPIELGGISLLGKTQMFFESAVGDEFVHQKWDLDVQAAAQELDEVPMIQLRKN